MQGTPGLVPLNFSAEPGRTRSCTCPAATCPAVSPSRSVLPQLPFSQKKKKKHFLPPPPQHGDRSPHSWGAPGQRASGDSRIVRICTLFITKYTVVCTPAWLLGFSGGGVQTRAGDAGTCTPPLHHLPPRTVAPSRRLLFALGPVQHLAAARGGPVPDPCGRGTWQRGGGCTHPALWPPQHGDAPDAGGGRPMGDPSQVRLSPREAWGGFCRRPPHPVPSPGGCCNGTGGFYRANPPLQLPGQHFPFTTRFGPNAAFFHPYTGCGRSRDQRGHGARGGDAAGGASAQSHPARMGLDVGTSGG